MHNMFPVPFHQRVLELLRQALSLGEQHSIHNLSIPMNLEELELARLPTMSPHDITAILSSLPRLKRLRLPWTTPLPPVKIALPGPSNDIRYRHPSLEGLFIAAELELCTAIYEAIDLGPTCCTEFVVTDAVSLAARRGVNYVGDLLDAISTQYTVNGGSALVKAATISVNDMASQWSVESRHSVEGDGEGTSSAPSLSLSFLINESDLEADSTLIPPGGFTHLTLLQTLLSFVHGTSDRTLSHLQLNVPVSLTLVDIIGNQFMADSIFYGTCFSMARATFEDSGYHLQRMWMTYPEGFYLWMDGVGEMSGSWSCSPAGDNTLSPASDSSGSSGSSLLGPASSSYSIASSYSTPASSLSPSTTASPSASSPWTQ